MSEEGLENYYENGHTCCGAGYLRFFLMAFVCFWSFGFPEPTGFLGAISGFAIPCFFILSGYFVLTNKKEERLKRTQRKIKRSLKCLACMFVFYLLLNIAVCIIGKISVTVSLRTVFNFIVLNLWPLPVGSNIWFIQSILYAYILIYIADKLNLMKYYKTVLILSLVLMVLVGEFAGLIHFNILGYQYIPGNWLTRAIPYILLGKFLREKNNSLFKINTWKYIFFFVIGAVLSLAEIIILGRIGFLVYEGHMIGYGIMAFSACGLAVSNPKAKSSHLTNYDTALSGIIYIFMDPIYYVMGLIAGYENIGYFSYFGGLLALISSILLSLLLRKSFIATQFFSYRKHRIHNKKKLKGKES